MTALSRLLSDEATAQGLTARAVARNAQAEGYTINHDTAARYLRGDHGNPGEPTLEAFAAVLGIPMRRLRQVAGLPDELITPYTPPAEASRLTRRQRRAVDEIIRAMLDPAGRRAAPAAEEATPTARVRSAARRGTAEPPSTR